LGSKVIPESGPDLNPLHAFVGEELDDVPLFEFHYFGAFRLLCKLFPA
jgi:hypothetical protein